MSRGGFRPVSAARAAALCGGLAAAAMIPAAAAGDPVESPGQCHQRYSRAVQDVRGHLAEIYGSDWSIDRIAREIAHEVEALYSADRELRSKAPVLANRRSSVSPDREVLAARMRDLHVRLADWQRRFTAWDQEAESWSRQYASLNAREAEWASTPGIEKTGERHYTCHGSREWCVPMLAKLDTFNLERSRLNPIGIRLQREERELLAAKNDLDFEEGDLALQRRAVELREEALEAEETDFLRQCSVASDRALALVEVLAARATSKALPPPSDAAAKFARAVGQEAIVQLFRQTPHPLAQAAGIGFGATFKIGDLFESVVDARTSEVVDNTYLLGDYALALRSLKDKGRLHPGDPGYDAIVRMSKRLGNGALDPEAATWTVVAPMLEALVAEMAGGYAQARARPVSKLRAITDAGLRMQGPAGQAFFRGFVAGTAEGGSSVIAGSFVESASKLRQDRRRRTAERWAKREEKE